MKKYCVFGEAYVQTATYNCNAQSIKSVKLVELQLHVNKIIFDNQ